MYRLGNFEMAIGVLQDVMALLRYTASNGCKAFRNGKDVYELSSHDTYTLEGSRTAFD